MTELKLTYFANSSRSVAKDSNKKKNVNFSVLHCRNIRKKMQQITISQLFRARYPRSKLDIPWFKQGFDRCLLLAQVVNFQRVQVPDQIWCCPRLSKVGRVMWYPRPRRVGRVMVTHTCRGGMVLSLVHHLLSKIPGDGQWG